MRHSRSSVLVGVLLITACGGGDLSTGPDTDSDAGSDIDADGDGDEASDADSDPDVDADRDTDADADGGADVDIDEPMLPPCDPIPGSSASVSTDPPEPWDGGSARVRVHGTDPLTNVALRIAGSGPAPEPAWVSVEGDGPWTWTWSLSPLSAGDFCLSFSADPGDRVYQRARMHVAAEAPPVAPFKVIRNHQWTCDEEYTWAINVDTYVLDESGAPMPGVRVLVEHSPCETAADHPPPVEVVTDGDGFARWENYNPRCFFHERVADAPSDTAIEMYTGIWEDQDGCNYCSTFAENVWGHWSYTVVFQRTPGALETCEVATDHEGQARCSPTHHWEEPSAPCSPL
jgi:hypothetical protein